VIARKKKGELADEPAEDVLESRGIAAEGLSVVPPC